MSRKFQLVWKIGISDAPKFFWEFFFPSSVLLFSFLGLWSRSINPPLQSLVNQYFSQTFERLFSKEEIRNQNPPRLRCSKMPRIWKEKSAEMSCVHFTRILGLLWHHLIIYLNSEKFRVKVWRIGEFFREQVWSCNPAWGTVTLGVS